MEVSKYGNVHRNCFILISKFDTIFNNIGRRISLSNHTHARVLTRTHARTHAHTRMRAIMHTHMHVRTPTCTLACTHTRTHTRTSVHTHQSHRQPTTNVRHSEMDNIIISHRVLYVSKSPQIYE